MLFKQANFVETFVWTNWQNEWLMSLVLQSTSRSSKMFYKTAAQENLFENSQKNTEHETVCIVQLKAAACNFTKKRLPSPVFYYEVLKFSQTLCKKYPNTEVFLVCVRHFSHRKGLHRTPSCESFWQNSGKLGGLTKFEYLRWSFFVKIVNDF